MTRIIAVMLLCLAALFVAPHADADDNTISVCRILDADPTPQGVWNLIKKMLHDGLSIDEATDTLVDALNTTCPDHWDELQRANDIYNGPGMRT